ncbi:hypothetical protein [Gracilibacillus sp. JCM 18860]|uniref:hypothetical protein n=1 Tax=Gracilibacillus sp. JCM 18860 TaxID=1306159 RepID=UPI0006D20C84
MEKDLNQTSMLNYHYIYCNGGYCFVLIRLANFLISDILELHGWLKIFSQFIAIILVIYPAKITFGSVLYHVNEDLSRKLAEET